MPDSLNTREELETELAAERALTADLPFGTSREGDLERALHRLDLLDLVGVAGGVIASYGTPEAIGGFVGTVIKVARTRALVDFGERGQWRVPFRLLQVVRR